jgi:hypothetical protein
LIRRGLIRHEDCCQSNGSLGLPGARVHHVLFRHTEDAIPGVLDDDRRVVRVPTCFDEPGPIPVPDDHAVVPKLQNVPRLGESQRHLLPPDWVAACGGEGPSSAYRT